MKPACIILAAGHGTRMKSEHFKVLHEVAGLSMLGHMLRLAAGIGAEKSVVVTGPDQDTIRERAAPALCAVQERPLGTGHAALRGVEALKDFQGDVIILYGDMPLLTPETLEKLLQHKQDSGAGLVLLGAEVGDPSGMGRLIRDDAGEIREIVEEKDATPEQLLIRLVNAGGFCADVGRMQSWLNRLASDNAQGELYLTDIVRLARQDGYGVTHAPVANADEVLNVNTRAQLARVEKVMQQRLRARAMEKGATLRDPESITLSYDTELAPDVVVEPHVFFAPGVRVGAGTCIRAFSYLESCSIGTHSEVGPMAHIRPESTIGDNAIVGNFTEINRSNIGHGSKVKHFSYLGDTQLGEKVNIGAGTVVANYDGFEKLTTRINDRVFVGTNVTLVAPLNIGAESLIAAGSVITQDIPESSIGLSRPQTEIREGAARRRRERKQAKQQTRKGT